jgi:hypothetical protein
MISLRRPLLTSLVIALALLVGARTLGAHANAQRASWPKSADLPWAPSAESAPYVSLGYRELLADFLWIRVIGYVGGDDDRAEGTRQLIEAIVRLDPMFERVYAWGGVAMSAVNTQASTADLLAAIRVLEQGMRLFPDNYEIPLRAGQIYTVELETTDPAQRREWDLAGARYLERAVRIPGAPRNVATFAAHLRTQLGQREKAVRDLRELIVYTKNPREREAMIQKLAELEAGDAAALDYELEVEADRFDHAWQATRPELPPSSFLVIGPPLAPTFRLEDLAVDRDLIGTDDAIEPLPPLTD